LIVWQPIVLITLRSTSSKKQHHKSKACQVKNIRWMFAARIKGLCPKSDSRHRDSIAAISEVQSQIPGRFAAS